jgi:hypothetical protein
MLVKVEQMSKTQLNLKDRGLYGCGLFKGNI